MTINYDYPLATEENMKAVQEAIDAGTDIETIFSNALSGGSVENVQFREHKHLFQPYAQKWFEVFSKPNIELVTAKTYERQLKLHIIPVLGEMNMEDILPADVQRVFNEMDGARETKIKTKTVLNMVFQQAVEDGLIQRNPLLSKSIRISGRGSTPTEPYSVAQMRFLAQHISMIRARVRSGMANARAKGKQIGRKPVTRADLPAVFIKYYPSYANGTMTLTELARVCGLSRPTIYKYLRLL